MTGLRILIAAGASVALASGAMAQTTVVTPDTDRVDVKEPAEIVGADREDMGEAPTVDVANLVELDDDFVLPTLNLPVDALDDYDLVDRNGEYVGEIEEVVGPDANTATAIVVEFDGPGWFLTDDDVERVVDIGKFSIEGDKLVIDIVADDAIKLPVYDD